MKKRRALRPAVFIGQQQEETLCCFFCRQWSDSRAAGLGAHDLHLLPIVGKLFTAIEAHDVSPSRKCGATTRAFFYCDRETIAVVPAAEERINDATQHISTSHRMPQRLGSPTKWHSAT